MKTRQEKNIINQGIIKKMAKKQTNSGITLIALVITTIVLLILAAVSIATLTGTNGILSQADKAGTETKVKGEEDQIVLSYNAVMTANKGTELTEDQFQTELQKYDSGADVTTKGEDFEVKFSNGNKYTVKKDGTIEGPTNNNGLTGQGKLAKDVLKVNQDAGENAQDYEKSPYVQYNEILCRVLYNDKEHGLQIISSDNMQEELTLGYGDTNEKVSENDFAYDSDEYILDDNFKKAASSYNRAVDTLNEKAKDYMLETDKADTTANKIAIDARSLGSIATLKDGNFQGETITERTYTNDYDYFLTFKDKFKVDDTNYEKDVNTLKSLGLNSTSSTWLASRDLNANSTNSVFFVRYVNATGVSRRYLCRVNKNKNGNAFRL